MMRTTLIHINTNSNAKPYKITTSNSALLLACELKASRSRAELVCTACSLFPVAEHYGYQIAQFAPFLLNYIKPVVSFTRSFNKIKFFRLLINQVMTLTRTVINKHIPALVSLLLCFLTYNSFASCFSSFILPSFPPVFPYICVFAFCDPFVLLCLPLIILVFTS